MSRVQLCGPSSGRSKKRKRSRKAHRDAEDAGRRKEDTVQNTLHPDEIQLWQAACVLTQDPSMDQLFTILKVADKLPDADTQRWTTCIAKLILDIPWSIRAHSKADKLLAHLLSLPTHLLHTTLTSCLSSTTLPDLLKKLPEPLHSGLIGAAIVDGTLEVPADTARTFHLHLANAVLAAPGLVRLEHDTLTQCAAESQAALLSRSVAAHSTLTRVSAPFMGARELRAFGAALPATPPVSVHDVDLSTDAHSGAVVALAETLHKFPQLTTGRIAFSMKEKPRTGESSTSSSLQSLARYAARPARLPKLDYLSIHYEQHAVGTQAFNVCVPELMSCIDAPALTSVWLALGTCALEMKSFLATLPRFVALSSLAIITRAPPDQQGLQLPAAGEAGLKLPALKDVQIEGCYARFPLLMVASLGAASRRTLNSLVVKQDVFFKLERAKLSEDLPLLRDAFTRVWAAVGGCSRLTVLDIGWLCGVPPASSPVVCSQAMSECLKKLPHLHCLILHACHVQYTGIGSPEPCKLNGATLAPSIRALEQLKVLKICHGVGKILVKNCDEFVRASCDCKGLRELWLLVDGLSSESVRVAVKKQQITELVVPHGACPDRNSVEVLRNVRRESAASWSRGKLYVAAEDGPAGVTNLPEACYDI